jgi:hypothetical protein
MKIIIDHVPDKHLDHAITAYHKFINELPSDHKYCGYVFTLEAPTYSQFIITLCVYRNKNSIVIRGNADG